MNGSIGNQKIKQLRDALQNSGEAVVVRIGMGYTALFDANSRAIG